MAEINEIFEGDTKTYSKVLLNAMKCHQNSFIQSLLQRVGNIPSILDVHQRTLLHVSAAFRNEFVMQHLFDLGCMIDARDEDGNTPLMVAIYFKRWELAKMLVERGADILTINNGRRSPVYYIQLNNCPDSVNILQKAIKDKKVNKCRANKDFILSKFIFRKRAFSDNLYKSFLMKLEIDERHSTKSNIIHAIFLHDRHDIMLNLKYSFDSLESDDYGLTALHAATALDDSTIRQMILNYTSVVDVKDKTGRTPLHIACIFKNVQYMKELLDRGANINAEDDNGLTPQHYILKCSLSDKSKRQEAMHIFLEISILSNQLPPSPISVFQKGQVCYCCISIWQLYLERIALLQGLNPNSVFGDQINIILTAFRNYKIYYEQCQEEINSMKNYKLARSITLFNVLIGDEDKIVRYARNEKFLNTFEAIKCEDFPIYYEQFRRPFDKGFERLKLLNSTSTLLVDTLKHVNLGALVIDKILSYISTTDLRQMNL